jgi:chemotaxis methyl-accepting protein methylase
MTRALAPDGLLVLGAGESILKLGVDLVRCANLPGAYYAKPGHPLL